MHAAAQPGDWWGNDFNPSQTAFARKLARASGAPVHLFDDAFSAFAARTDLPQFDFIGLHGIWSWVSDENRRVIVDFIRDRLKVGGVLYVSYNTLPGWSTGMPLQHLITEHARSQSGPGIALPQRIDAAIGFAQKIFDMNPLGIRSNPQLTERLARIKEQDRHYLAHEYFNRDWKPMYFREMADWLAPAKLSFAASANVLDNYRMLHHAPDVIRAVDALGDPVLRETVLDFCVNQQFRKDLWVRGPQPLQAPEADRLMREQHVMLVHNARQVKMTVKGAVGEMTLDEGVYRPVIDQLADHRPRRVADLERELVGKSDWRRLREVLTVLIGTGAVMPVQGPDTAARQRPMTSRLNDAVIALSASREDQQHLASPVSGGGVGVSRVEQFFLAGVAAGHTTAAALADFAWAAYAANGEKLVKDGKRLERAEDNIAMLAGEAQNFIATRLPVLRGLGIAA